MLRGQAGFCSFWSDAFLAVAGFRLICDERNAVSALAAQGKDEGARCFWLLDALRQRDFESALPADFERMIFPCDPVLAEHLVAEVGGRRFFLESGGNGLR